MDEIIRMVGGAENIWNANQTNAERVGMESNGNAGVVRCTEES